MDARSTKEEIERTKQGLDRIFWDGVWGKRWSEIVRLKEI